MNSGPKIKIYKQGDPILNKVAESVAPDEFNTENLQKIVDELKFISNEMRAVGFSAPQIGYSKRVMMIGMEFENPRRPNVLPFPNEVFINPEVTTTSPETTEDLEGCASLDDIVALVPRAITIQYKAQDLQGNPIEGELKGFRARVFLHEVDHLNGILMTAPDRAISTKKVDDLKNKIISMKP